MDQLALGVGVAFDVALGHVQAGVAGELLHVAQGPSGFRGFAGGAGDEGVPARMGGTPRKAEAGYRRRVAVCFAGGENLDAWLVEHGWALAYARYSQAYAARQKRAEAARAGIWPSRFQKPWEWRWTYTAKTG